jgi:hypothetical protein
LSIAPLVEIEWISTQWTSARVAGFEPFEQAARMEEVLAGRTTFGGQLFVATDHGITDGALGLAFERSSDVLSPGRQSVDNAAVLFALQVSTRWSM